MLSSCCVIYFTGRDTVLERAGSVRRQLECEVLASGTCASAARFLHEQSRV
jgi:hypothetical protein